MTLAQIEKIKETISNLNTIKATPNINEVREIDSSLQNYFQKNYQSPSLWVNVNYIEDNEITNEALLSDINSIVSTLEGMIDSDSKAHEVLQVLNLVDEGTHLSDSYDDKQRYISKIYFRYGDKIKFDKSISVIANKSIKTDFDIDFGIEKNSIDDTVIDGIVYKLRLYCQELLEDKKVAVRKESSKPQFVINNNNSVSANANVSVDISISIEQAKEQVEDAGLSDEQYKAVMEKLKEIEEVAKSKDSKGKRWQKAKEILKWVAEQGIQVAGIILPLLSPMIGV